MKKFALALGLAGAWAMTAMAGTWTGYISESGCGAKHVSGSAADIKCVTACVKKGAAPVFVTADDKKVLKISDPAKVMGHLGHKVTVTGKIDGDTLSIDSVKMAE